MGWAEEVRSYWFALRPEQWWRDTSLDGEIAGRFGTLWEEKRQLPASAFLGSADDALAAVLLFDQFPRNMFRGHADQFSTDLLALQIARGAIDRGYDDRMSEDARIFLYLPFEHSEDLEDQQRSVLLFTALGKEEQLRFAKLHFDIIEHFGRFPHRNAILGRTPRPEEVAAGEVVPW
ncbi:DUF924 family protein [Sphingosinicella sp. BN140058]|uniref:DUF924 family protein n=1 Tax=Sphingosinicella sp. BN140058 TaxID=1892855 RepID=UPI00101076F7|nr:DUF924 family protein [Sphingosinicella sp. BN140058]QAY76813.1 DUF924 domain-containing protein [Sphingosinicella sp. BN140058]